MWKVCPSFVGGPPDPLLLLLLIAVSVGIASHFELAKAQMRGRQRGFLKLLVDAQTRRVLGVHVLGEQVELSE